MNNGMKINYRKAIDSIKLDRDFDGKTIARLKLEAEKIKREAPAKRNKRIRQLGAAAAALVILGGGILYDISRRNIGLPNSDGVSARYAYFTPLSQVDNAFCLAALSEEEAVGGSELIISGQVISVRYIKVDFGGGFGQDWSIITVRVEETLKNDAATAGETISFLHTSPPASSGIWSTANEVAGQLSAGSRAILFLKKYGDDDLFIENGNTLRLSDLSEYGMPNGVQYAIIKTDGELVYSKDTYNLPDGATYSDALTHVAKIIG